MCSKDSEWTPTEVEVVAAERVLCEVLSDLAASGPEIARLPHRDPDGYWAGLCRLMLEAAEDATAKEGDDLSIGEVLGITEGSE